MYWTLGSKLQSWTKSLSYGSRPQFLWVKQTGSIGTPTIIKYIPYGSLKVSRCKPSGGFILECLQLKKYKPSGGFTPQKGIKPPPSG